MPSLTRGLCVVIIALIAMPAFAQFRIDPNDDLTLRGTTNYNATGVFGLFVKNAGDVSYLEFTLGSTSASEAKLVLWQGDTGVSNPWTIVVRGQEFDFNETTFTAYTTGLAWPLVNTFDVTGTTNNPPVQAFYEMDLTTWYNANLGRTVSLFMTRNTQPGGSGPIFEDREGTKTGDPVTYGPRIEWVPAGTPCDSVVGPSAAQTATALRGDPAAPASFVYTFINSGTGANGYTVAETDANGMSLEYPWLTLSKSGEASVPAGGGSDDVTATITDTSLSHGTHTAYITFTHTCTPAMQHIRQIDLVITDCTFTVSPAGEIARSVTAGSVPSTPDAVFTVTNTGTSGMTYSVQEEPDCPWLTLSKAGGGPLANGATDPVSAGIEAAGLATGVHTCTLRFSLTTPGCSNQPADILRTVVVHVLDVTSAFQQFNAEFTSFTGSDLVAVSPLISCDPSVVTTRDFHIQSPAQVDQLDPGWLTQGSIEGTPTTARFYNPPGPSQIGNGQGRARFRAFLPFDNAYAPGLGMAVAWRMRVGDYSPNRGPIQITFPRVTGPFGTAEALSIPGEVFNCYIRIQNGRNVRILDNGGGSRSTIDTFVLPTSIADEYHQWTAAACYNGGDEMAYWNLWLDGVKLLFTGADGSVSGPGDGTFSFRTPLEDVTPDPYVGLGDLGSPFPDVWDFDFDWVRMLTYNVVGCPFWDGEGCAPVPACPIPFADADEDGDVDSDDFAAFQRCINTGLGSPPTVLPEECRCFDRNSDKVVGTFDLALFEACNSGPGVPWQPTPGCQP